jgi:hypothetical protein
MSRGSSASRRRIVGSLALCSLLAVPALADAATASPFDTVDPGSAGYAALAKLIDDRQIPGYDPGSLDGKRTLTRAEAASMTARAAAFVKARLSDPKTAPTYSAADLSAMQTATQAFQGDEDATAVEAVKAQVDNMATNAKAHQIHGFVYLKPGVYDENVDAHGANHGPIPTTNASGAPINNVLLTNNNYFGPSPQKNFLHPGDNGHGSGMEQFDFTFTGVMPDHLDYAIEMQQTNFNDGNYSTLAGGQGSSSLPPFINVNTAAPGQYSGSGYYNNSTVRLKQAYVGYDDPRSGWFAKAGRFLESGRPLAASLAFADWFQGLEVGVNKPTFTAFAGWSGNYTNPGDIRGYGQSLFGHVDYHVNRRLDVGANYVTDLGIFQETVWDASAAPSAYGSTALYGGVPNYTTGSGVLPLTTSCPPSANGACGAYVVANYPLTVGALDLSWHAAQHLDLVVEGLTRFGDDPTTRRPWQQAQALAVTARYGDARPEAHNTWLDVLWNRNGFNSTNGHSENSGPPLYPFFSAVNGYTQTAVALDRWLSPSLRLSLTALHADVNPGTTLPAGSATCPGCYVAHDKFNALYLQGFLPF